MLPHTCNRHLSLLCSLVVSNSTAEVHMRVVSLQTAAIRPGGIANLTGSHSTAAGAAPRLLCKQVQTACYRSAMEYAAWLVPSCRAGAPISPPTI